ncbi:MAG TPA: phosphatidylserine decarboxylase family protein [Thermodesulfobacteriota bacterium]|nr:phosphatidylserine decarboxylase family protein [Thermodesulfobacteriota bacterium]
MFKLDAPNRRNPIAREGWGYILVLALIALFFWAMRLPVWATLFTLITAFVVYFFRDPERVIPEGEKTVLSPADGRVVQIEPVTEEKFLKGPAVKVSIFMSLFDVHVNRNPLTGRILDTDYAPGKFLRADLKQASVSNERNALLVENEQGSKIVVVQVAGLIARRIVCRVKKSDPVERGKRFGLICFGSRLDIYLPEGATVQVKLGQKTRAGETILGMLP